VCLSENTSSRRCPHVAYEAITIIGVYLSTVNRSKILSKSNYICNPLKLYKNGNVDDNIKVADELVQIIIAIDIGN